MPLPDLPLRDLVLGRLFPGLAQIFSQPTWAIAPKNASDFPRLAWNFFGSERSEPGIFALRIPRVASEKASDSGG